MTRIKPCLCALLLAVGAYWARAQGSGNGASQDGLSGRVIRLDAGKKPEATEKELADAQEELREIQRRVDKGDLPKVQFDFDSDALRPEATPTLEAIADLLRRNPRLKLVIFAHTCNLGSEAYNLRLSQRRAKSVKGYLAKRGVPPPAMRFHGKGFSQPIADNSTEEGRIKNRRVEFQLLRRWWSSVY